MFKSLVVVQVNILMHSAEVKPSAQQLKTIAKLKQKHRAQDVSEQNARNGVQEVTVQVAGKDKTDGVLSGQCQVEDNHSDGGAIWDIFRREDVPKLEEYLRNHCTEYRDLHCSPVEQVSIFHINVHVLSHCLSCF